MNDPTKTDSSAGAPAGEAIPAAELRKRMAEKQAEKAAQAAGRSKVLEEEEEQFRRFFMTSEVTEEDIGRIRETVYRLAERGETSFMIAKFPSDFCADGGRAINNNEPDWPKTLTGRAEQMYDRWRTNAKPLGYKLKAEVLNYPQGIIGEIGLFVEW